MRGDASSSGLQEASRPAEQTAPFAHLRSSLPLPVWLLLPSARSHSPAGLAGHPSVLPIREPRAHAPGLVSLKLKACSVEPGPLQTHLTLIIPSEGVVDLVSVVMFQGGMGMGVGGGRRRGLEKISSLWSREPRRAEGPKWPRPCEPTDLGCNGQRAGSGGCCHSVCYEADQDGLARGSKTAEEAWHSRFAERPTSLLWSDRSHVRCFFTEEIQFCQEPPPLLPRGRAWL